MNYPELNAALIILRCDAYLKGKGITNNAYEKYPSLSGMTLSDEDLLYWSRIEDKLKTKEDLSNEDIPVQRYARLLYATGYDPVLRTLLDLCIAIFIRPELGACLSYYFGASVNLHLANLLEGNEFPKEEDILRQAEAASVFCYVDKNRYPIQYNELQIDEKVMSLLSGSNAINNMLAGYTELFNGASENSLHDPFVWNDLIEQSASFFSEGGEELLICGKGGRRFLAKKTAGKLRRNFLFLNIADFFRETGNNFEEAKSALLREAIFQQAGICFYGINRYFLHSDDNGRKNNSGRDLEILERILFDPILQKNIPLILCLDSGLLRIGVYSDRKKLIIELPDKYSFEERRNIWAGFKDLYDLPIDPDTFAMRYHLTASETAEVIDGYIGRSLKEKEEPDAVFTRLSMQLLEKGQEKLGRIVYPDTKLSDVKIKPALRQKITDMLNSVRYSHKILEDWDLKKKYPYGRASSLLMSGPPGTGKTMTANALAGELQLPLYQVNLSNIMDKYVGETEKNLEKVFSLAERINAVLFFDEADALFGKRSEVKNSQDKYANSEISYLLQRVEAFEGIVILATNIKGNIDPAFLRRIRYVVFFENPDEAERKEIWESCLTDSIPHEELDFDYLASQFKEFTGSIIKTVFLNACSLAASENKPLSMKHLIRAIRSENEKTSTVSFSVDVLGKYAYLS